MAHIVRNYVTAGVIVAGVSFAFAVPVDPVHPTEPVRRDAAPVALTAPLPALP